MLPRGQFDEAMGHFLEALRVKPDFAEAHYNLGNALFILGRLGEAMTQYEKALEFRPDYAEAHYNLGLALEARGRLDDAVRVLGPRRPSPTSRKPAQPPGGKGRQERGQEQSTLTSRELSGADISRSPHPLAASAA